MALGGFHLEIGMLVVVMECDEELGRRASTLWIEVVYEAKDEFFFKIFSDQGITVETVTQADVIFVLLCLCLQCRSLM
jgi:hypothetical protein